MGKEYFLISIISYSNFRPVLPSFGYLMSQKISLQMKNRILYSLSALGDCILFFIELRHHGDVVHLKFSKVGFSYCSSFLERRIMFCCR